MTAYAYKRIREDMKRTNLWLRTDHLRKLKALSADTGAPVSALIRKAIDFYLEKLKKK